MFQVIEICQARGISKFLLTWLKEHTVVAPIKYQPYKYFCYTRVVLIELCCTYDGEVNKSQNGIFLKVGRG